MVDIGGRDGAFRVNGLADPRVRYATRVAAFEAAVAAAGSAIGEGRSVIIRVRGSDGDERAPGDVTTARPRGRRPA